MDSIVRKVELFRLTDAAARRVRHLLEQSEKPDAVLRVSVKTKGCSGLAYDMDYADAPWPMDEVVEDKGVRVCVDPLATMYLAGTVMDYVEETFNAGFVFNNPNEKGRCGCGESFHV
jgi:iron-sulfur cluster assembly protein